MTGLIRLLGIGLLSLIGATWNLWAPQNVFPQVPLIRAACDWPGWLDWGCLAILLASAIGLAGFAHSFRLRSFAAVGIAGSLAFFFVLDQHRLQPWAWQFFLLAIVLSLADDVTFRRCWTGLVISIYFWSGVSKLDYTFCHVQGPALLAGLKKAIGLWTMPSPWTETLDVCGSLGIAVGELLVALLLMGPRSRRWGCWAATLMHLTLLAALGPRGLRHSYGVLMWNVFFVVQNWMLFRRLDVPNPADHKQRRLDWLRNGFATRVGVYNQIAVIMTTLAIIWPSLESLGWCDHWLAWAVYSARSGTVEVVTNLPPENLGLPIRPEPFLSKEALMIDLNGAAFKVNISQWSLDQLGVPLYPEQRFQIGIVWKLKRRFAFEGVVLLWEMPDRMTGRRAEPRKIRVGNDVHELEKVTDSYRWNARPRRTTM